MAEIEGWVERTGVRLRGVAQYLRDHDRKGNKHEVLEWVAGLLEPNEHESSIRTSGDPLWLNDVLWQTTNLVKAGWMTKDGAGNWTLTDKGVEALDEFPDPADFHRESTRLFNEWKRRRDEAAVRRRAWLVRGSSVLGVNVVPEWLTDGFVSLAASQLRQPPPDVSAEELEAMAKEDYDHLKHQELRAKVEEIVAFVTRMRPGDVILTTSEHHVYLGDVTGDWAYARSEGEAQPGRAARLRRAARAAARPPAVGFDPARPHRRPRAHRWPDHSRRRAGRRWRGDRSGGPAPRASGRALLVASRKALRPPGVAL